VLNGAKRRRRTSADHQCPSAEIFFTDKIFLRYRIIPVRNKVYFALEQVVYLYSRDLFRLFFQCKDNVCFIPEKCFHAVLKFFES